MHICITREPLDLGRVLARVGNPEDGAALLFVGTVRSHNENRPVTGLRYDAYVPMAENVLRTIAAEALERIGATGSPTTVTPDPSPPTSHRIAVVHRIGELSVGEASVAIAISSPHRAEAFDACRYVIEEIKRRVPVWKEERYVEGEPRWLGGRVPPVAEATYE